MSKWEVRLDRLVDNLFVVKSRTCPHVYCGKSFDCVESHQGMVFCPYCKKNILVNPLSKVLENQSFFEFVKNYFKKYYKLLLICCAIIVAMEGLSGYIDDFVGFTLISTLMIGVMVFLVFWFGIDVNKREFYNLSGNPIFQGVDSLSDIQSNSKHQVYRENLEDNFYPFACHCPHCQSQRIIQKSKQIYHCEHCRRELRFNQKIKHYHTIKLTIMVAFMIVFNGMIDYEKDGLLWLIVFGGLLLTVFLVHRFIFLKTPKWLI